MPQLSLWLMNDQPTGLNVFNQFQDSVAKSWAFPSAGLHDTIIYELVKNWASPGVKGRDIKGHRFTPSFIYEHTALLTMLFGQITSSPTSQVTEALLHVQAKKTSGSAPPTLAGADTVSPPHPRQPAAVPGGPDNSPLCQKRASCEGGHSLTSLILPPFLLGPPLWQSYRAEAQGGRHYSLRCHSSLHFSTPPTLAHQSEVYYTRSGSISFRKADLLFYHWCFRKHPIHTAAKIHI